MALHQILKDLQRRTNKKKAEGYQRFFKQDYTDKKDRFIGISLPEQRGVVKRHKDITYKEIQKLLKSDIHEYRMLGGLFLLNKFKKNKFEKEIIFNFYMKHKSRFNNWDLVDVTADKIIGKYLFDKKSERKILHDLAKSDNLWDRRISIISTHEFIRHKEFDDALKVSKFLLSDKEDLTHKAVGWTLREIGKRDKEILLKFLKDNYKKIPRTTLRYSIEKFPEDKRKNLLKGIFE